MSTETTTRPSANATLDLPVVGMHCAACANRIEKALSETPGVSQAGVNFATARATVQYDPTATSPEALRDAVRGQGDDAVLPAQGARAPAPEADAARAEAAENRAIRPRFVVAAVLTVPVLILEMGGHIFPAFKEFFHVPARPWIELALTSPVLFWAGRDFFLGAWAAA